MKTTKEMMNEVIEMKKVGKVEIWFDVDCNTQIFVEVVTYESKDDLEIAIELRNIDTNETYEVANCDYNDNDDIESGLDYVRRCALDRLEEGR